jgi:N-acetyl-gamma-glutamyl-phosphate reductase
MIHVGILGATGYAGLELTRILLQHPEVGVLSASSVSFEGESLEDVYPSMVNRQDSVALPALEKAEKVIAKAEVVFSCLPHGHAEEAGYQCVTASKPFIDISADFRFGPHEDTFKKWYGAGYHYPDLHAQAVYGLPELHREAIESARLIANPGCYPTSAELGLMPVIQEGIVDLSSIVITSMSGVTGAGREPSQTTHYPEAADAVSPYKVGAHRHQPEIDLLLSEMAGTSVQSVFTPILAPMNRGIVSTICFRLARHLSVADLYAIYAKRYAGEPFVRVLPLGSTASNRFVKFSNYCDISVHLSADGERAVIISAIDNMVKGAAGQAVQNMNILLGFEETEGLRFIPPAF